MERQRLRHSYIQWTGTSLIAIAAIYVSFIVGMRTGSEAEARRNVESTAVKSRTVADLDKGAESEVKKTEEPRQEPPAVKHPPDFTPFFMLAEAAAEIEEGVNDVQTTSRLRTVVKQMGLMVDVPAKVENRLEFVENITTAIRIKVDQEHVNVFQGLYSAVRIRDSLSSVAFERRYPDYDRAVSEEELEDAKHKFRLAQSGVMSIVYTLDIPVPDELVNWDIDKISLKQIDTLHTLSLQLIDKVENYKGKKEK